MIHDSDTIQCIINSSQKAASCRKAKKKRTVRSIEKTSRIVSRCDKFNASTIHLRFCRRKRRSWSRPCCAVHYGTGRPFNRRAGNINKPSIWFLKSPMNQKQRKAKHLLPSQRVSGSNPDKRSCYLPNTWARFRSRRHVLTIQTLGTFSAL